MSGGKVVRYAHGQRNHVMTPHEHGPFVRYDDLAAAIARAEAAERDALAMQARIDALMMEYCPDEITGEQLENWMAAQSPVPEPLTMSMFASREDLDAAIAAQQAEGEDRG